ncbi:unnamed protein product [Dovyalis caffra]|uniref:Uncharacterized protein n=1 Tax=Dovyalis caffra TaxID=77055 RepID=A0AAV1R6J2_9ROSI|nr:unnamed protein product [Dovyalis caffra]
MRGKGVRLEAEFRFDGRTSSAIRPGKEITWPVCEEQSSSARARDEMARPTYEEWTNTAVPIYTFFDGLISLVSYKWVVDALTLVKGRSVRICYR